MTTLESGWATTTPVTVLLSEVWLKSSTNPALNMAVCLAGQTMVSAEPAPLFVHRVQDRRMPIVHQGSVGGESMAVTFGFNNDAEWLAFRALRDLAEPLLLQTPYGDIGREQFWLRLGDATVTRFTTDDMNDQQARVVTYQAVEVGVPGGP
jgi:hypothetical protein